MVAGLLDGPRARRAFLLRCTMDPPWALRIQDEAPLSLVAMLRGSAWYVPDEGDPATLGAGEVAPMRSFGVRRWGNAPDGSTEILTGTYNAEGEVSRRLLDALPSCLLLRAGEWETPLLGLLADEMLREEVGQDAVLD